MAYPAIPILGYPPHKTTRVANARKYIVVLHLGRQLSYKMRCSEVVQWFSRPCNGQLIAEPLILSTWKTHQDRLPAIIQLGYPRLLLYMPVASFTVTVSSFIGWGDYCTVATYHKEYTRFHGRHCARSCLVQTVHTRDLLLFLYFMVSIIVSHFHSGLL